MTGRWLALPSRVKAGRQAVKVGMQLSDRKTGTITIREQLREIESELFLLSAGSVALTFDYGQRFERLSKERTRLASRLLLNGTTRP